jgi:hypothetical protein
MTDSSPIDGARLVIASEVFSRGLVFTDSELIGCRLPDKYNHWEQAPLGRDGQGVLHYMSKHQVFRFALSDVTGIEFEHPGKLHHGRLVFHTGGGDYELKLSGTFASALTGAQELLQKLEALLQAEFPGKLRVVAPGAGAGDR